MSKSWHSIRPGSRAGPLTSRSYSKKFTSNLQIFITLKLLKQTVFTLQKISGESRLHSFKKLLFSHMKHAAGGSLLQHSCRSRLDRGCGTCKLKSSTLFGLDAPLTLAQSDITQVRDGLRSSLTTFSRALSQRMCGAVQCSRAAHVMFSPQTAGFSALFPQSNDMHDRLVGENDNFLTTCFKCSPSFSETLIFLCFLS